MFRGRSSSEVRLGLVLIIGATVRVPAQEIRSTPPSQESDVAQLEAAIRTKPADAALRDVLDDVWQKYRTLQSAKLVDDQLRSKVVAFVKEAWSGLEKVDPSKLKHPLDKKKSAKWNRENQLRPVRRFDGEIFDKRTGHLVENCFTKTTFEKPFQLVAIHTSAKFSVQSVNKTNYLLVTPSYCGGGKTYAIELPKNFTWDDRVTELSVLAEVESRAVKCGEYSFDVILRPLILCGVYWIEHSGQLPVYIEQVDAFR